MNGFPFDPSESAPPPLGPAISSHPSPRRSALGELAEPLAPFGVRAAQSAPPPPAAPPASPSDLDLEPLRPLASVPDLDLDVEPLTPLAPEIDAIDSGSGAVDDLPWISLDEPVEEVEIEQGAPSLSEEMRAWDAWASAGTTAAASEETAPASVPAPASPLSAADSIAARLEEIARTLREHGPAGLLMTERSDPLRLLIAGYALGHAAAEERGGAPE